jgi:drug/metabolite transporter (DMT)-like permease
MSGIMQPAVAALIVGSAFLHALWNALLKRQRDPEGAAIVILAVAVLLAVATLPLASGPAFPSRSGLGWALAAGVCEGGYFVTLALAFRGAPLGVVYTIARGGALAAVWPISALWLGEAVTARSAAGAATLAAGLVLVGLDRGGRASPRGVLWAVLCAAFIAGYLLCYKCALATGAAPAGVFTASLAVALPVNVARLGRSAADRSLAALRASPLALAAAGVLCSASFLVFLAALARGGVGAAATLRNTSVLFALLLAWAIGERPGRPQVLGTVGVALGAVLIGWPP